MQVVPNTDGTIVTSGSFTASATFTDTTPSNPPFFAGSSMQATYGPFNYSYSYPVTYTNGSWSVGTLTSNSGY